VTEKEEIAYGGERGVPPQIPSFVSSGTENSLILRAVTRKRHGRFDILLHAEKTGNNCTMRIFRENVIHFMQK